MKFTRLPDGPKARPAPLRWLPPLEIIRSVESPDERAQAFRFMTFRQLTIVWFGGRTVLLANALEGAASWA